MVAEFSSIVGDEKANVTSDKVSLSVNSNVNGVITPLLTKTSLYVAFTAVPGETTRDSANSYKSSSSPTMEIVPVVCPAKTSN